MSILYAIAGEYCCCKLKMMWQMAKWQKVQVGDRMIIDTVTVYIVVDYDHLYNFYYCISCYIYR